MNKIVCPDNEVQGWGSLGIGIRVEGSWANWECFRIKWMWRFYRTNEKSMINGKGKSRMTLGLGKHKIFSDLIPYKLRAELRPYLGSHTFVKEQETFNTEVHLGKDGRGLV